MAERNGSVTPHCNSLDMDAALVRPAPSLRRQFQRMLAVLPKGRGLDEEMWGRRHHVIVGVLWLTAAGLAVFGIARGFGIAHTVLETSMLGAAAVVAMQPRFPRRLRSAVAATGLMAASALFVHLWSGAIEAHFLFFVFVALLSVYQDWVPFLIALGFVVVHHGLFGVLIPTAVYDHTDAIDNPWLWALIHGAFVLAAAASNMYGWLSSEEDHRRAARGLQRSEATFRALFDRNPQPMWVYEAGSLQILSVNNAAVEHYGYSREEFLGMRLTDIIVQRQDAKLMTLSVDEDDDGDAASIVQHRLNGGRIITVIGHSDDLDFDGHQARVQVLMDITERIGLERELRHRALHDSLTSLGNRDLFHDRLEHALARERGRATAVVAAFDLDGFKGVNDAHGHGAGDAVLVEIARRMSAHIRPEDTAARMGGDECSLIFEDTSVRHVRAVVERLANAIRQPIGFNDTQLRVTASVGIASGKGANLNATELLRRADVAMYEAKAAGKDCSRMFRRGMQSSIVHRTEMASDLREAIARNELRIEYQPIVNLNTHAIRGVEALARWQHPRRGLVAPSEFIPVAEETGLIVDIGNWVLEEACRQLAEWRQRYSWAATAGLSLNVSPRQLSDPRFERAMYATLAETGVPAKQLTVEVTETAVVDDIDQARLRLGRLRTIGIKTAVDDFGSGYSSIAYLNQLPLDEIKIDRIFTSKLGQGESKELMVALVRLVDTLGVTTVIEGIETQDELDYALALGFDEAQGYYFSRPVPPADVPELMAASVATAERSRVELASARNQVA
ncbi:MAG: putative bifunctional diguanylate cyclase/phosphodiesterase [Candidatus Dormibacteria bacterium]